MKNDALFSLSHILSFTYLENPISNLYQNDPIPNELSLELSDSVLEFTYENAPLNSRCNLQLINQNKLPFFSSFRSILFEKVTFPLQICPLIFLESNMAELRFSNLSQRNVLNFIAISNTSRVNFNATVKKLEIQESFIDRLDNSLLNKDIFFNLEELKLSDTILKRIEDNLFESFKSLKLLLLYLENFSEFIGGNNTWMKSLTTNGQELLVGLIDSNKKYEFSEEDFCNFIDFPHEKKVYPFIQTKSNLNCSSCTLAWLLQNWTQSSNSDLIKSSESVYDCLNEQNIDEFNARIEECDFDSRIKVCLNIVDPVIPPPPEDYTLLIVLIVSGCFLFVLFGIILYLIINRYNSRSGTNNETKLLNKYRNIFFHQDEYDYGFCSSTEHSINIEQSGTNVYRLPTASGQRPATSFTNRSRSIAYTPSNNQRPILINFTTKVNNLLRNKIISQVQTENNMPIQTCPIYHLNGTFQVDFTNLNSATKLDESSHLLDEETKQRISQANIFTILDFNSGAYQIKLEDASKQKTIFNIENAYFQFEVMPEGMINSRETFHRLMIAIMPEFLDDFCLVYNGKLIVHSLSEEENFNHLNKVMDVLGKNKLKIKKENCLFFQKEINLFKNLYKDHMETRNADMHFLIQNQIFKPQKSQVLKNILDLFEYYKSDLDIAQLKLMKDLTENFKTNIKWNEKANSAFHQLKIGLLNAFNLDLAELSAGEYFVLIINFTPSLYTCSLHIANQSGISKKALAFCSKNTFGKKIDERSVTDKIDCVIWAIDQYESILFNKNFQIVFTFHFQTEQFELKIKNNPYWISKMQAFKFSLMKGLEKEDPIIKNISSLFFYL